MSPISKMFKSKEQQSREAAAFHCDLERGHAVTPPLPSSIFKNPAILAAMPRDSYSAPPSMNPMKTVQRSSRSLSLVNTMPIPEKLLLQKLITPQEIDPERYREALGMIEGTSPASKSKSRNYVESPLRPSKGDPLFPKVDYEPERDHGRPPIPRDSPDVPWLPAKAYVPLSKSREPPPRTADGNGLSALTSTNMAYAAGSRYSSFMYSNEYDEATMAAVPQAASLDSDSRTQINEDDDHKELPHTTNVQENFSKDGRPVQTALGHTLNVNQDYELYEDMTEYEQEGGDYQDYQGRYQSSPGSYRMIPTHSFVPNPDSSQLDEYAWSPAHSEIGEDDRDTTITEDLPYHHEEHDEAREHDSISSTYLSWLAKSDEDAEKMAPLTLSGSPISSSIVTATDATPPVIDTFIPAGSLNLDSGANLQLSTRRELPEGQRFSVIMSDDGTSPRPMSNAELEHSLSSIEEIIKSELRISPSDSSRQGVMAAFGDHDSAYLRENSHPTNSKGLETDPGPGSSQTPSYQNTDRVTGINSGRQGRIGFYDEVSSSRDDASSQRVRSPTQPLLYGRSAYISPEPSLQEEEISRPILGRNNSRLGRAMQANGVRKDGRLAQVYPLSKADHDWETVSDIKELGTSLTGEITAEARSGSSLADNSDSGSLSLPKRPTPLQQLYLRNRVLQHPAHPRENQSYMVVKDNHTGETYSLPQSGFQAEGRAPCVNITSPPLVQTHTYQHPTPFSTSHNHPFLSTPPQISAARESPDNAASATFAKQHAVTPSSRSSEMSDKAQKVRDRQAHKSIYELTNPVSDATDHEVGKSQRELGSKERSHFSSGWVSTISEGESALPRLPTHESSFAKVSILGHKGNVTGTPEGTGAREVGSSLADGSSPGAKFSSSPAPFATSPRTKDNTPSKAGGFQSTSSGSATPNSASSSATRNYFNDDDDEDMPQGKEWLKYLPPRPVGQQSSFNLDRHRRSSTESGLDTRLESPASRHHERGNTSTGLLLGQAGSYSRDHEIQPDDDQHSIRERRAHRARIAEPATPSSTESTPVRDRNGRVFTDVPPPVFVHPVYGRNNPWDETAVPASPHLGRGRQNVRPRPMVRPIARVESPHLYRTPRQQDLDSIEHAQKVSFWLTTAFCVVPFLAIIPRSKFGDTAIDLISGGKVEQVDQFHKRVAGFVFVLGTPILAVIIMLAVYFKAIIV